MPKTKIHAGQIDNESVRESVLTPEVIDSNLIKDGSVSNPDVASGIEATKIAINDSFAKFAATNVEDALTEVANKIDSISVGGGTGSATGSLTQDFNIKNLSISGNILPTQNGMQSIGSDTNRFGAIYVNEAYLSTNTLYLGDTPVMGTNKDTIEIKADADQGITIKTTATGQSKVISESGVELSTSGMNADVKVQATGLGGRAVISANNQVAFTAPYINLTGDTSITGNTSTQNLTVNGIFVMNGTAFTVNAQTLEVKDNIIAVNKGQVGSGVSAGTAGVKVDRGDADDYYFVFDETDDMFKVGTLSTLETIASQNWVNGQLIGFNHSNLTTLNKLSDVSGQLYYNGTAVGGGGTANIDDTTATVDTVYSSSKTEALINEAKNANNIVVNDASNVFTSSPKNLENVLKELFTSANSAINGKELIAASIVGKGVDASSSDSFQALSAKIGQISSNLKLQATKLNVNAPYQKVITLTNPVQLTDLATSIIEYAPGLQGVVQYSCSFNNGDAANFNPVTNVSYDGTMHLDPKSETSNLISVETYTSGANILESNDIILTEWNTIDTISIINNEVPTITVTGVNTPVIVKAVGDIDLTGIAELAQIDWTVNTIGTGKLLLLISIDSGITWNAWDVINSLWQNVNISNLTDVATKGMNANVVSALTAAQLELLRNGSSKIRFAYYLEQQSAGDEVKNDAITLKVNMPGTNKIASGSKYSYSLSADGLNIIYNFNTNGTYTINLIDYIN